MPIRSPKTASLAIPIRERHSYESPATDAWLRSETRSWPSAIELRIGANSLFLDPSKNEEEFFGGSDSLRGPG